MFEISEYKHETVGITVSSGDGGNLDCHLNIYTPKLGKLNSFLISIKLPQIIKPKYIKNSLGTVIDVECKVYGLTIEDNLYLHFQYGEQSWSTYKSKQKFYTIPFLEWRLVNFLFFDNQGKLINKIIPDYDLYREAEEALEKSEFIVTKNNISVKAKAQVWVEGLKYKLGKGWFKGIFFFVPSKTIYHLKVTYVYEETNHKGTYRISTPIDSPDNLIQDFRELCDRENLEVLELASTK